jgi:hypothetical protein
MRILFSAVLVTLVGCGMGQEQNVHKTTQGLECKGAEVPIYRNNFQPYAGGSGVASGADAAAGRLSEDSPGQSAPPPLQTGKSEPLTAMTEQCGQAPICFPGQVAVEELPRAGNGGGGIGTAGPTEGDFGGDELPPSPPTPPANPTPAPLGTVVCADAPPQCPAGESPQFTSKRTWECTDCGLVVTFGGIFGNYRRCVNNPTLTCPQGQVPTFGLENETWECKPTCDNGMYDQHTVNGTLVCVPC